MSVLIHKFENQLTAVENKKLNLRNSYKLLNISEKLELVCYLWKFNRLNELVLALDYPMKTPYYFDDLHSFSEFVIEQEIKPNQHIDLFTCLEKLQRELGLNKGDSSLKIAVELEGANYSPTIATFFELLIKNLGGFIYSL